MNEDVSTIKQLIVLTLFTVCLQTFALEIAGNGVTVNYVYVLIPFIFWLIGLKRRLVRREQVVQVILFYGLIYLVGFPGDVFNFNHIGDPTRRLASFLVFLFPILLSLVEFKPVDIDIFKRSVIVASALYSFKSVLTFVFIAGGASRVSELKGLIGSQRYGFILCLGFFIALFNDTLITKKWILPQRALICSIIFIGAIFTYSRSTMVSLIGGLAFFVITTFKKNRRTTNELYLKATSRKFKPIYLIALLVVVVSVFIAFQHYFEANFLRSYQVNLLDRLLDNSLFGKFLEKNQLSSEGVRYYLLTRILNYLVIHPLFGSSYQGLYLLYDEFKGGMSSHNQYADVFLRTGLFGGALWLFLLYRVYRFCGRDRGLQVGLVAIFIYGFFHETFKESHGSFVFGMLLSFSYMSAYLGIQGKSSASVPLISSESS